MITQNQRYMISYTIDHIFYLIGQDSIDLTYSSNRNMIHTYFNNWLDKEVKDDVTYAFMHGERVDNYRPGARQFINVCLREAIDYFIDNTAKVMRASYRGHRVAMRSALMLKLKTKMAEHERVVEGREKALRDAKLERERLKNGE